MLRFRIILFCIPLYLFTACQNDNFSIGKDWVDVNTRMIMIDTLTVNAATMWSDSVITSGKEVALIGQYNDPFIGKITASSYIELSLPASSTTENIDPKSFFDSLVIQLTPKGTYFGDTLQAQTINVHQTKQALIFDDNQIYNSTVVGVDNTVLATAKYVPKPSNAKRVLTIRLPDTLGQRVLDAFTQKLPDIESDEKFARFFKALAFLPEDEQAAIVGYNLTDSLFKVTLYYHEIKEHKLEKEIVFKANKTKQYNNIKADRSATLIKDLSRWNIEIPSTLTNNQAYAATGVPLSIKLSFPYLNDILLLGKHGKIAKAELKIRPFRSSFPTNTPLPRILYLNVLDVSNTVVAKITNSRNEMLNGGLKEDYMNYDCYYTFDITGFLNSQLGVASGSNNQHTLQLFIPPDSGGDNIDVKTIQRLVIGDTKSDREVNRMQLKIYYSTYHGDN